jgi:hypothetical protein
MRLVVQHPRFVFEHQGDAVTHRKSKAVGMANQLLLLLLRWPQVLERAFADRANQQVEQSGVHQSDSLQSSRLTAAPASGWAQRGRSQARQFQDQCRIEMQV